MSPETCLRNFRLSRHVPRFASYPQKCEADSEIIIQWMGAPNPLPTAVTQTSFEYTSTRSTFVMDVASVVEMNITFLSPITPTDLMRQSLVFSYVEISVTSTDGAAHDVQLYTDVTAGRSCHSLYLMLVLLTMLLDRMGLC